MENIEAVFIAKINLKLVQKIWQALLSEIIIFY